VIVSGHFDVRFRDEEAARAAAREARCVGFVVVVHEHPDHGWLIAGRRRAAFPADERDRYASRLHAIAAMHGGEYFGFVKDTVAPVEMS
jgi:hypothetical protein